MKRDHKSWRFQQDFSQGQGGRGGQGQGQVGQGGRGEQGQEEGRISNNNLNLKYFLHGSKVHFSWQEKWAKNLGNFFFHIL